MSDTKPNDDMTVKELKAFAGEHGIEIPGGVKRKGDILELVLREMAERDLPAAVRACGVCGGRRVKAGVCEVCGPQM